MPPGILGIAYFGATASPTRPPSGELIDQFGAHRHRSSSVADRSVQSAVNLLHA